MKLMSFNIKASVILFSVALLIGLRYVANLQPIHALSLGGFWFGEMAETNYKLSSRIR
jgi:hypothetical protein